MSTQALQAASTLRLARPEITVPTADAEEPQSPHPVEVSPHGRFLRYEDLLGRGAHKDVYKAYDTEEGTEVAWNVAYTEAFTAEERLRMQQEIALLKEFRHDHIISFVDSWQVARDSSNEPHTCVFVTELMTGGTLRDFMRRMPGGMRYAVVKRWCRNVLSAVAFLHQHDPPIIHRDLKLDNFFYDAASGTVRIGDFGLSTSLSAPENLTSVGTPVYMAPEMWGDDPYDEKVDIYAFGLSVLEMLSGDEPFFGLSLCQIYTKTVLHHEGPKSVHRIANQSARSFVRRCIVPGAPDKRPSAAELLLDPFLQERPEEDELVCEMLPLPQGHDSDYHAETQDSMQGGSSDSGPHTAAAAMPFPFAMPEFGDGPPLRRQTSETADAHAQRARISRHMAILERMKSTSFQHPQRLLNTLVPPVPERRGVLLPLKPALRHQDGPAVQKISAAVSEGSGDMEDVKSQAFSSSAPMTIRLSAPSSEDLRASPQGRAAEVGSIGRSLRSGASDGDLAEPGGSEDGDVPGVMKIVKKGKEVVGVHSSGFTVRTTTNNFEGTGAPADITAMLSDDTAVVEAKPEPGKRDGLPESVEHARKRALGTFGFVRAPSMSELRVLHQVDLDEFLNETQRLHGSTHTLTIRLNTDAENHYELEFPFDTKHDTPDSVARELMDALKISQESTSPIQDAVRLARDGQLEHVSGAAAPPAVPVSLHVVLDQIVDKR